MNSSIFYSWQWCNFDIKTLASNYRCNFPDYILFIVDKTVGAKSYIYS